MTATCGYPRSAHELSPAGCVMLVLSATYLLLDQYLGSFIFSQLATAAGLLLHLLYSAPY